MHNRILTQQDELLHETRWLRFIDRVYRTADGETKRWSFIERSGCSGAVVVIPVTRSSSRLLLLKQYRVPLQSDVIEFPAGLIDRGESAVQAALRELREETGFTGEITSCSGPCCTSPGLTSETVYTATALIDEQPAGPQQLESSEQIETFLIAPHEAEQNLSRWEAAGAVIDTKVRFLLAGMALSGSQPPA